MGVKKLQVADQGFRRKMRIARRAMALAEAILNTERKKQSVREREREMV